MSACRKTVFNKLWMCSSTFPDLADWVEEVSGSPLDAFCKVCRVKVHLSNMGRQALSSHAQGAKHKKYANASSAVKHNPASCTITSYMAKKPVTTPTSQSVSAGSNVLTPTSVPEPRPPEAEASETVDEQAMAKQCLDGTAKETERKHLNTRTLTGFVSNDDVTAAEIRWALKCIKSHYSYSSSSDAKDLFQMMFKDSSIAQKLSIGSTKLAYYITFGLAPYFHNDLLRSALTCSKIVVCFEEAVNRVAQRGQMDVVIRFWNNTENVVSTRYFGSAFIGHATSDDLLKSFKSAIAELPMSSVMQVSMDGPSVNIKFIEKLRESRDEELIEQKLLRHWFVWTARGARRLSERP